VSRARAMPSPLIPTLSKIRCFVTVVTMMPTPGTERSCVRAPEVVLSPTAPSCSFADGSYGFRRREVDSWGPHVPH
jgi:hypothetical protein